MQKFYNKLLLGLLFFLGAGTLNAQVTVTNPANVTPALAATYTSLALAINDLNATTAISGQVIITLSGNETAPAGGYSITAIPAGASAANNIIIEGSSSTITAFNPQVSGNINDAVFKLIGADFITIRNFTMQENALNVTTTTASNNMTEWGVALLYASLTNGAQNNIIQNNTISLNRTYLNTFGIYSNTRHNATAPTTSAEVTSAAGANSGNKVYGNAISNVNFGIIFIGAGTTLAAIDNGNDIGGTSSATGNTITNWGGGITPSSYVSLTGSNYCIFINQQINDNISYNSITSATLTNSITTGGLLKNYSVAQPVAGTVTTTTINNNTVTVTNNPSAATNGSVIGINNQGIITLLSTATMSISNNTVQNCVLGGTTSTTNGLTAITNLSAAGTININGNTVLNNSINATTATSGTLACIINSGAAGNVSMSNNILRGQSSTATSGQMQGIVNSGAVVTTFNVSNNQFGNAAGNFFSSSVASSGSLFGISSSTLAAACASTIQGNDFRGIVYNVAASSALTFITTTHAGSTTDNVNSNTFTNLSLNTTGSVTFIARAGNMTATGIENVNSNSIVTAFNKTGAGGTITLFTANASSVAGSVMNNSNNNFSNITVTGATIIAGWSNTEGGAPAKTISNNTFNNWTGGTSAVTAISSNFGGNNVNVTGNTITNITSTGAIAAISTGSSNSGAAQSISGNTIGNLVSSGTVLGINGGSSSVTTFTISGNSIGGLSSAAAGTSSGINVIAGVTTNISKNRIYDISGSVAGSVITGINTASGTTFNISNNLVGDLRTPAGSGLNAINGINCAATSTYNVYYNSIYLNASSSAATFGNSCITFSSTATSFNSRNNLLYNSSTPGLDGSNAAANGVAASLRRSTGTTGVVPANYAVTSNNNAYWPNPAAGTNNHLVYVEGTGTITNPQNTVALLKAFMGTRDQASVQENVSFQSTAGASANFLKYNTATPSQLESGAANVAGITDDYAGTIRQGNGGYAGTGTAPDIGAWELEGIAADLTPPNISYTALLNSCASGARTLTATITDASGVPTSGAGLPVAYYRINAGPYMAATGTFVSGNTYTFSIGAGSVSGDVISYYIVAQDGATIPNVGSSPAAGAGGFTANPPAAATPPTSPGTYTNNSLLAAGTYSVGAGTVPGEIGHYATLTAAVADYNGKCVGGNVVFALTDALYSGAETFPIQVNLNPIAGSSNTLTIQPAAGIAASVVGSNTTALFSLNGAKYISFDGLNTGGASLLLRNTASGPTVRFINDAVNNTITNSTVESANTSTTSGTVLFSTSTGTLGNSNNIISSSILRDRSDAAGVPANAVYSSGTGTALNASNTIQNCMIFNYTNAGVLLTSTGIGNTWLVSGNSFYQTAARTLALTGIAIQGGNGHSVLNNSIGGTAANAGGTNLATSSQFRGIDLTVGTTTATSVQGNTIKNIRSTYSLGFTSSYGIFVQAGLANIGTVTGNTIGSADPAERIEISGDSYAIRVTSSSGANIINNIVNNFGTAATAPAEEFYYGISVEGAGSHSVINNTVTNLVNRAASDAGDYALTIGLYAPSTGVTTIRGNTLSNIGSGSATTGSGGFINRVWGILLSASANGTTIEKNVISNIYGSSTGTGTQGDNINGIQVQSSAFAAISNNMISIDAGNTADRSVIGIVDISGTTTSYNYNTVSITGTASGTNNTWAFNRAATTSITLMNNIFSNTRTGGTGFHVALANSTTATGWPATASNYNDFYSATPANTLQWLGNAAANNRTLATWQAAQPAGSGGDANSVNVLPVFVSATDLHLTAANCGIDGRGTPIAITTDIDNTTRNTGAPDMGADEFTATPGTTLAVPAGPGTASTTYNVSPSGTTYSNTSCEIIAKVMPSGATPVAGSIRAAVTVDASVQVYLTRPYVQRHYDIEPATGAATATATVTLYFTDQEFIDYNAANTGYYDLPTVAGGGTADPATARLRVIQYHGTGTTPGTYTGATEVIDPADADIVYNATSLRWEVTIPVNGFSGFYISTDPVVTPINISYFRGARQNSVHNLEWKVNVTSSPTVTLTLERSADSRSFSSIYSTTATDTRTLQPFNYTDNQPMPGVNYYRLKMVDVNGRVNYSGIVALINGIKGFELIGIAPNPVVNGSFKLNITSATSTRMDLQISDMQGKIVLTQSASVSAGSGSVTVEVGRLAAGTYNIYGITPEGKTRLIRFVKN